MTYFQEFDDTQSICFTHRLAKRKDAHCPCPMWHCIGNTEMLASNLCNVYIHNNMKFLAIVISGGI